MKTLTIAVLSFMLGMLSVKTAEEVVVPRIMYGYNKIDDQRHDYCKQRSRKWYRKISFQVGRTYQRCMDHEI
jgi:hypothetical protein